MNSFSSAYPDMDTNQTQLEGRFAERVIYEDAQSKVGSIRARELDLESQTPHRRITTGEARS